MEFVVVFLDYVVDVLMETKSFVEVDAEVFCRISPLDVIIEQCEWRWECLSFT